MQGGFIYTEREWERVCVVGGGWRMKFREFDGPSDDDEWCSVSEQGDMEGKKEFEQDKRLRRWAVWE